MEELINVNFRPEEPGGARETIGHYRRTQDHAKSMWAKINDHESQAAELSREIRDLTRSVATLEAQSNAREVEAQRENGDELPGSTLVRRAVAFSLVVRLLHRRRLLASVVALSLLTPSPSAGGPRSAFTCPRVSPPSRLPSPRCALFRTCILPLPLCTAPSAARLRP
jgi:hypothetical protein